jgi:DNA modification methylase
MKKKRPFKNRLNDLDTKTWIKFQKSWFVHDPPRRKKDVLRHPAKFPETLAQEFVEFFTKTDETVLDPMAGTGSTAIACLRSGRNFYGIELNPVYAEMARQIIDDERQLLGDAAINLTAKIYTGDAAQLKSFDLPQIDYVLTSPPYWDMLRARGTQTQQLRRMEEKLDVYYSDSPADLGNIVDYDQFLAQLATIYIDLHPILRPKSYLTIIIKNIKKGGKIYPLAWDLGKVLGKTYTLKDEKIWCQDDIRLAPYGMGNAWVSNTFHHYCLQFRHEPLTS